MRSAGDRVPEFDYRGRLDELRCHATSWLEARRVELRREQQRLRVEELAVLRILDERRAVGPFPDPAATERTTRELLDVARALESTPAIAAAAHDGALSWDQLAPLSQLATAETDREWALRAPSCAPIDLAREARKTRVVTPADAAARRAARELRTWREPGSGMIAGRFRLPDVDGVIVEDVLEHMAERMRPAKGQPWDTVDHRKADALVELCSKYASIEPRRRRKPLVVVHLPAPAIDDDAVPGASVAGIAIANSTARELLVGARVVHDRHPGARRVAETVSTRAGPAP
jgi:hypothetical protein